MTFLRHYYIDSRDRVNSFTSNTNDCRLFVKPSVGGFTKVELLSFSMPLTSYNVDGSNNKIYFNVGASSYIATITVGSYNICTLTPELKRVMDLASTQSFDIWYDSGLFKLVFTISSAADFAFTWGTNAVNSAFGLLGFRSTNSTPAQTIISDNAINLSLPLYFYIQINQMGSHARSTNEGDWATFVISSQGNSASINIFNQFSSYHLLEQFGHNSLNAIDIRICERGNKLVDLNNSDWSMLLRFWYKEVPDGSGV